jgi:hypothetical protein
LIETTGFGYVRGRSHLLDERIVVMVDRVVGVL